MPNDIIGVRSSTPQNIVGILRNVGSGRGIASIDLDSGCHLVVTYTDGTTWTSDETLRGITSATVTDEYKLKLTYEDGTTWESTQSIRGPVGPSTDTKVGELEDLTTVEKGTAVGAINELDAKGKKAADSAYQLLSKKTTENTDPYLFRISAEGLSDRADDTIVGGTVAWNQLFLAHARTHSSGVVISCAEDGHAILNGTASSSDSSAMLVAISIIANHKYILWGGSENNPIGIAGVQIGNTPILYSVGTSGARNITTSIVSGTTYDNVSIYCNIIDLTQLFGTEIADYIYSLETAGAGIAWFRQYFPADYYPYNTGELVSVKPTAKVTKGFNQWDEEWELGSINLSNGATTASTEHIRSKNYCTCFPNTAYYIYNSNLNKNLIIMWYDADMQLISYNYKGVQTSPANAHYFKLRSNSANDYTSYADKWCINISNTQKNGTYEPYAGRTYPLGAEVRGLISLSNGKLAFNNGDIYTPDGKVRRKYWIDDLGSLTWIKEGDAGQFRTTPSKLPKSSGYGVCSKYTLYQGAIENIGDKEFALSGSGQYIFIRIKDSTYASSDATAFKNSLNGHFIIYELATPTTEQSLPYDSPQVVFPEGTEQYVDDRTVPLPVGHVTTYHTDMRNKLESLPDSTLEHWETGISDQLATESGVKDKTPYLFRKAGGGNIPIGTRMLDTLIGGTVAWNQLNLYGDFPDSASLAPVRGTASCSNNILTFSVTEFSNFDYAIRFSCYVTYKQNHKYLCSLKAKSSKNYKIIYTVAKNAGAILTTNRHNITSSFTDVSSIISPNDSIETSSSANGFWVGMVPPDDHAVGDTVDFRDFIIVDLTQLFGSTIADYIYNLEQNNSGAGVAWFKHYFPKDYYLYNPGELISVHPSEHITRGFNQLITQPTIITNSFINDRNKATRVFANTPYHLKYDSVGSGRILCASWGLDGNLIHTKNINLDGWYHNTASGYDLYSTDLTGREETFTFNYDSYVCFYYNIFTSVTNMCLNVSNPQKNGIYEPYIEHSYPLSNTNLRGLLKLDSNYDLYYDGDINDGSGKVQRKYGIVTLDENSIWGMDTTTSFRYFDCSSMPALNATQWETNVFTNYEYSIQPIYPYCQINASKKVRLAYSINDTSVTTVEQLKAKLAAHNLQVMYPLATPVTEDTDPFQNPQIVDAEGTEEYIDARTVPMLVAHETLYLTDMRKKVEDLPTSSMAHWETGSADQLTTKLGDTEQAPYLFRQSGGDLTVGTREYDALVGGTVAWNQLIDYSEEITAPAEVNNTYYFAGSGSRVVPFVAGHKYFLTYTQETTMQSNTRNGPMFNDGTNHYHQLMGTNARLSKGQYHWIFMAESTYTNGAIGLWVHTPDVTVTYSGFMCSDLTAMFGTTIADYVYSLETATAGSGMAWLKQYGFIDGKYHPYNAGSLVSVHPSQHKTVGFNQWDEEWENGIWSADGAKAPSSNAIRSKNYIPVIPGQTYYTKTPSPQTNIILREMDASKTVVKTNIVMTGSITFTSNTYYVVLCTFETDNIKVYNHNICLSLSKTIGSPKNGDYVSYSGNTYQLPNADLRGIFKLDSNNKLYCDGDTDDGSGTRTRKYGIVDLGTLTYNRMDTTVEGAYRFFTSRPSGCVTTSNSSNIHSISTLELLQDGYTAAAEKDGYTIATNLYIYTNATKTYDTAQFKAAMSGVYLVYELATPTIEESTPFQNPQIVDPDGTEKYIDTRDVTVPTGHSTRYPKDLKRKLEELPDPPSGANGTYILKATINNGVTTYSWVVE